jgi:hypothetical protein
VNHLGRAPELSVAHSCSPVVHSHRPLAPCMSSTVRVASHTTADMRAELKRRRSGEDGRIPIERQWERHCYQGRNLDGDFDVVDTAPVGQATRTPTPLAGFGGGCMVLALHHRMVVWPRKFWPICWRSMIGVSTSSSSYGSTPPRSSPQEEMRPSWPTISRWP